MVRKLKGPPRPPVRTPPTLDREAALRRAAAHYNADRFDDAEAIYAALTTQFPDDPLPPYLRGLLCFQRNRHGLAVDFLQQALTVCRTDALCLEIETWLGRALTQQQNHRDARLHLEAATRWAWNDPVKLAALIPFLSEINSLADLEPLFRRVLDLQPDHVEANAELALIEIRRGDVESAQRRAVLALQQKPDQPAALRALGHLHHELGEPNQAAAYHRASVAAYLQCAGVKNVSAVYECMLGALVYDDVDDLALREAHQGWQSLVQVRSRPRRSIHPRRDRPLRVGYVSPDFRQHPVAAFFEPLLRHHDPASVTTFLYSNHGSHDQVSDRLRASASAWREIVALTDDQVIDRIEEDGIDILVDLAGVTIGNRMGVFHQRAAPLQVNYLGYPCTTGLAQMDYRFTDEDCDPLGETDAAYSEQLVRLPGGFYAWRPPDDPPAVGPSPARTNGFPTFGSLQSLAKISDDVIALWSQLLGEVRGARLVLQASPFTSAWVRDRILGKFATHGIEAARIDLLGRMSMHAHLDVYNQVDIALDPFPWGGHTTTCTALFMGVPVVTLRGQRVASRMSASALRRMGLDAWIAQTPEQYLAIARGLAADVEQLAALRRIQRAALLGSDLVDGRRLARVVEAAYQALWDHHAGA